ncbi:MAG: class I adenylate-forming enzyme family protein [Alphaproteobacteria bacterium]
MNIVGDFLLRSARRYPDKIAVIDGDVRLTYRELTELVSCVAAGIRGLGIEPGDRISYHGNNRWELVVTLLASIQAGTILVPLNVMFRPAELAHVLSATGIKLVLTTTEGAASLESLRGALAFPAHVSSYDDPEGLFAQWIGSPGTEPVIADRAPTDIVTLFFTSGTTGKPKGAPQDHEYIDHVAHSWVIACRYAPSDIFLVMTPMFWAAAPLHCILPIILVGASIVVMSRFDPDGCCDLIRRHSVTAMFGVPTMYAMLADQKAAALRELSSLRVCAVAGAPISAEVVRTFERLTSAPLLNIYGATEAGAISREMLGAPRRAGYTGTLGGTVETKIVDAEDRPVAPGTAGEIVVRGLTVIRGYWEEGRVNLDSLPGGWFHTGDIGILDDGFLRVVDRIKDMIITGGANIYPAEIEDVINRHPKVRMAAVIGAPDRVKGELAVAYVVPKQAGELSLDELEAHCRELLASYKVPRRYVLVNSLPLTQTGKIQKAELRKAVAGR